RFTKVGAGTLLILSANGQQDDVLQLNQGTIAIQNPDALGRGDSGVEVDMKSGTTLVYKFDSSSNVQTPIVSTDPGGTINVVIDRITAGPGVSDSINALSSAGAFTLNVTAGANVSSGVANLSIGAVTPGGDGTLSPGANSSITVTGAIASTFGLAKA